MPAVSDIIEREKRGSHDDLHPIYWREYPGEWLRFHADNPEVYDHLRRMAIDLIEIGHVKKWGMKLKGWDI